MTIDFKGLKELAKYTRRRGGIQHSSEYDSFLGEALEKIIGTTLTCQGIFSKMFSGAVKISGRFRKGFVRYEKLDEVVKDVN
jgi:hypothetical protein